MAERIPPLTPRQSRQIQRYAETKRLAEMAWQAILSESNYVEMKPSEAAEEAWTYAEFMRIASENRRPVE